MRSLTPILALIVLLLFSARAGADTSVSGTISGNNVWTAAGSPYVMTSTVTVAADATLTIESGVTVRAADGSALIIAGKLTAAGTAANPIIFTTDRATPAPAAWYGIEFRPTADPTSSMAHASIQYGGFGANRGIVIDGSAPRFDHVTIADTAGHGVLITGASASPVFTNCTLIGNHWNGLYIAAGTVEISDTAITSNGDFAINAGPGTKIVGLTGMTVTGHGGGAKNAIRYRGGVINTPSTWLAGMPWVLAGTVTVASGASLTVSPGATVRSLDSYGLTIEGKLTAVGTTESPILFTSDRAPAPGAWYGIEFGPTADQDSRISHATIRNGGYGAYRGLLVNGSAPQFDHVTIADTAGHGVLITGANASPVFTNCTLIGNHWNGLYIAAGTVEISDTAITSNGDFAINAGPGTKILGLTGMTVSGHGGGAKNAIGYRGGIINTPATWPAGMPWVLTGTVTVASGASLTVSPGATVRSLDSYGLAIEGKLTAVGTTENPILFTSDRAPAPGAWYGIEFGPSADPDSRISHATIRNGGYGAYRGLLVNGSAPHFDHVTIAETAGYGVLITGANANPVFTNCTVVGNHWNGLYISAGAVEINDTAITSNGDYAILTEPVARILGLTGMTVSGNNGGAKDVIAHRGGTISAPATWLAGIPWVLTGNVTVAEGASLAVSAGVTVRVLDSYVLVIAGKLTATGTAASPVVFTSARTTPAPGSWYGLDFRPTADPTSSLAYASIQYGGFGASRGVYVDGSRPVFDHVTVSDTQGWAVSVVGSTARPKFTNCLFLRNGGGVTKSSDATVDARLSYWGAATGPSVAGPGAGQSVGTGVLYEPWLSTPATAAQFLTAASIRNPRFNPSIQTTTALDLMIAQSGSWAVTITNGANSTVRTFTGTASPDGIVWDGRDQSGALLPDGTYPYEISTTGPSENGAPARGRMILDSTMRLAGTVSVEPLFSPNGDGVLDIATVLGTANFDDASWMLTIKNAAGATVRQSSANGPALMFAWDGRDTGGTAQPDGPYSVDVYRSVGSDSLTNVLSTVLDVTAPVAVITAPAAAEVFSNVYRSGTADVSIEGTATDANLDRWNLDFGAGTAPTAWTFLKNNITTGLPAGQLALWKSLDLNNGAYTFRLQVWDKGGIRSESMVTTTISNFRMSKNVDQFKPSAGQTATYTSIVPFALNQALTIRNEAGTVVRTLFDGPRTAATHSDVWDGRTDSGTLAPDGPYLHVATVTDGTHSMTWDLTNEMRTDGWVVYYPGLSTDFDPFNNKPLALTYTFDRPGRIYVIFSPHDHPTPCVAPAYCWKNQMWQESGTHTLHWAGIDDTHKLRPDLARTSVTSWMTSWPKNAVLVYGTKPTLSPVTVTPPYYGPAAGAQSVSFTFTTCQSQPATVQASFRNMSSGSVLRTVTQTNQSPGATTLTWDGRADNGMWVAPGQYVVTVTVTDAIGNSVAQQILTNIAY